jgi:type IX secretion system PorP/SprF family membrane protein
MKRMLARVSLTTLLVALFSVSLKAQDPQYSQFYSNLVMLNPAFTGSGIGPRVALNYRAQWVNIPGFYNQFAVSYDQPLQFLGQENGIGVNINADQAGEGNLTKINATFNYSYQVEIVRDHFLRAGISAGIIQASIDPSKLRFPDQIDPRNGFVYATQEPLGNWSLNRINPDVNAGLAYFNEYAWLGATVNHITQPDEVFTNVENQDGDAIRLPRKYTFTGGLRIPLRSYNSRRELSLSPAVLYKMQGEFRQIDVGLYVNADPMVFGVWYRHQDAVIGLIGVQTPDERVSFGYSFDYTISTLTQGISGGSHEISLVMEFEPIYRRRSIKHRSLPCPKF